VIGLNIEASVQKLLDSVIQKARDSNFSKVTAVYIVLGPWENVDINGLTKTFDRLKGKDLLADAELVVDKGEILARCRYCGSMFEVVCWKGRCKHCGSSYMEFIGDRGITLKRIEGIE
jgi:Zn finger protein HypA/HybF involved in hydrogenase expression